MNLTLDLIIDIALKSHIPAEGNGLTPRMTSLPSMATVDDVFFGRCACFKNGVLIEIGEGDLRQTVTAAKELLVTRSIIEMRSAPELDLNQQCVIKHAYNTPLYRRRSLMQ